MNMPLSPSVSDVKDIKPIDLLWDDFDLIIAAAGYEPRCTNAISALRSQWSIPPGEFAKKMFLLKFKNFATLASRIEVDRIFAAFSPAESMDVNSLSGRDVRAAVLRTLTARNGRRILVDYTSLSRSLYLCLLSLLREGYSLTFIYSIGDYGTRKYPVSAVGDIRTVPGLEGIPNPTLPKLYLLGLGYDGIGTEALLDKLEAERYVVYWTNPGAAPDSQNIVREENARIIERAQAAFSTDLRDISRTVEFLRRFAVESAGRYRLILTPVGPKPHVLASGIVAAEFDHATLLAPYLGVDRGGDDPPRVGATGEMIVTRVARGAAHAEPSSEMALHG